MASQLIASTDAAAASLARGNTNAATGQLSAFIRKVLAAVQAERMLEATGNARIAYAQSVLHSIGS